jgi:hypothetical protein
MEIATQNIVLLRASIHDGWFLCQLCMNLKVKNSMMGSSAQGCRTQFWGFSK